jgi:hypothetical protein
MVALPSSMRVTRALQVEETIFVAETIWRSFYYLKEMCVVEL